MATKGFVFTAVVGGLRGIWVVMAEAGVVAGCCITAREFSLQLFASQHAARQFLKNKAVFICSSVLEKRIKN